MLFELAKITVEEAEGLVEAKGLDAAATMLSEIAERVIVSRVSLSPEQFLELHELERAAFFQAGKRLDVEQALRIGKASRSDIEEAAVAAEIDGGEEYDRCLLERAVLEVAQNNFIGGLCNDTQR